MTKHEAFSCSVPNARWKASAAAGSGTALEVPESAAAQMQLIVIACIRLADT